VKVFALSVRINGFKNRRSIDGWRTLKKTLLKTLEIGRLNSFGNDLCG